MLQESIALVKLFQYNSILNYNTNILDLFFSNIVDIDVPKTNFSMVEADLTYPCLLKTCSVILRHKAIKNRSISLIFLVEMIVR